MAGSTRRGTAVIGETRTRHYRTLFISDVHLGTRSAQTDALLDFLRVVDADVIYLVGDIVDFWKVRRGPHWPQSHNDVLQKLLRKVRKGCRIIFIPGNHDDGLRDYCGVSFGGIDIRRDAQGIICGHIHHAANRHIGDVHYLNCGDWVESCTAIYETYDGEFGILRWLDEMDAHAMSGAPQVVEAIA